MNPFYKYPECEPLKTNYYLCSLYNKEGDFNQFAEIFFLLGEGFKQVPKGLEVVAFTELTAEEAAKTAQI
jgi:hypothetical protein